jgi:hypothetical protein
MMVIASIISGLAFRGRERVEVTVFHSQEAMAFHEVRRFDFSDENTRWGSSDVTGLVLDGRGASNRYRSLQRAKS